MDPIPRMLDQAVSMGTTIAAFTYDGGVVMAADSRTSTGSFVANRVSDKISMLADNVFICRSGSAADTQAITSYVRHHIDSYSVESGTPGWISVKTAAMLVMQIAYRNKDNLQAGMIVAGWDREGGAQVYGIPLGGTLLHLPFTLGGSGSTYIYGWVDSAWRDGMTCEECEQFAVKAVSLAIARDGSSGGVVRLVTIDSKGVTRKMVPGNDVPVGYDEIQGPPMRGPPMRAPPA